ncbi:MAG: hypothetical protein IT370_06280 [Deltaproteobacteria bacterium]|nr:hypothetical protein [Deltaproteobacteria bacterium]
MTRSAAVLVVVAALALGCGPRKAAGPSGDASTRTSTSTSPSPNTSPSPGTPPIADGQSVVALDVPEVAVAGSGVVTQNPIEPDPCTLDADARFAVVADAPAPAAAAPGADADVPVLAVRCGRLIPHAQVVIGSGAEVELVHRDGDVRHELTVERLADESGVGARPIARVPLPLRGARVLIKLPGAGLYRVSGAAQGELAHILVSGHPWATVISGARVRFAPLPGAPRSYDVVVIEVGAHPPVRLHQDVTAQPLAVSDDPGD